MNRLSLRGVCKRFQGRSGQVVALDRIDLEVPPGEFLTLVGPSGCGKSTLLNIIAGLEPVDAGDLSMDGEPITCPSPARSMVFQSGALFPWLSVVQNVEFGLKRTGVRARDRRRKALDFLDLVQLGPFAESCLHELSGGMRQRVAIARALAVEPQVLLMDEPFASLDAQTREDLYGEVQRIWERLGTTILFVTHNVREAVTLGDRVVLLGANPGRIQAEFPVRILRPREIDDLDVARLAKGISLAMKHGDTARDLEGGAHVESDASMGLLLDPDRGLGAPGPGGGVG